jgi:hypothetical protein
MCVCTYTQYSVHCSFTRDWLDPHLVNDTFWQHKTIFRYI